VWPHGGTTAGVQGDLPSPIVNRRTLSIFGWIAGFFVSIWWLGFSIGIPLVTSLQLKIGAREKWSFAAILAVLAWAFFYGVFETMLKIPFPTGLVFSLLEPSEAGNL
jgi:Tripartite tricarboxylate transporter TctB family